MITQQELKDALHYDPETGLFTWRRTVSSKAPKGSHPNGVDKDGYLTLMFKGKFLRQHRVAWFYTYGVWPEKQLDHINGVRSDNRIVNLRACDEQDNNRNRAVSRNNTSGVSGVSFQQGKWMVRIRTDKQRRVFFGYFDDIELAELVAAEAREKYHGEFARHLLR